MSQDYMCKIVQTVQPSTASKCIQPQAVFGNVLDKEEVQVATDLFWKYMELSTNSVRRDNPLTLLGVSESFGILKNGKLVSQWNLLAKVAEAQLAWAR